MGFQVWTPSLHTSTACPQPMVATPLWTWAFCDTRKGAGHLVAIRGNLSRMLECFSGQSCGKQCPHHGVFGKRHGSSLQVGSMLALLGLAVAPTSCLGNLHDPCYYHARLDPTTVSPCELKRTGTNVNFFGTDGQEAGGILGSPVSGCVSHLHPRATCYLQPEGQDLRATVLNMYSNRSLREPSPGQGRGGGVEEDYDSSLCPLGTQ